MLACKFLFMGPAKHEEAAIFCRKMSGFRMFEAISERYFAKKARSSYSISPFVGHLIL